jgi:hypothetical protein
VGRCFHKQNARHPGFLMLHRRCPLYSRDANPIRAARTPLTNWLRQFDAQRHATIGGFPALLLDHTPGAFVETACAPPGPVAMTNRDAATGLVAWSIRRECARWTSVRGLGGGPGDERSRSIPSLPLERTCRARMGSGQHAVDTSSPRTSQLSRA